MRDSSGAGRGASSRGNKGKRLRSSPKSPHPGPPPQGEGVKGFLPLPIGESGARGPGFGSKAGVPSTRAGSPITDHRSPITDSPWRIGQSVVHATFGAGVIVSAEGRGADARVQVNFRDAGVKWLALDYAKLEAA